MSDPDISGAIAKLVHDITPYLLGPMLGEPGLRLPPFATDVDLKKRLEKCAVGDLADHCFAVVDLTDDGQPPKYAGHNDRDSIFVASIAKVLALYGAYRLRADARTTAFLLQDTNLTRVGKALRTAYRRVDAATGTRPLVEDLFEVTPSGHLEFKYKRVTGADGKARRQTDGELNSLHVHEGDRRVLVVEKKTSLLRSDAVVRAALVKQPIHDQLRLMAGWSDNTAAGTVIHALGYPYLWALTTRSGLYGNWEDPYDPDADKVKGGLVLAGDYCYGGWSGAKRNLPSGVSGKSSNARALALLFTAIAKDALVGPDASSAMREIMRKLPDFDRPTANSTRSRIGAGLARAGITALQPAWDFMSDVPSKDSPVAVSKVGLIFDRDQTVCDAIIVRTPAKTKSGDTRLIHFVIVGLLDRSRSSTKTGVTDSMLEGFGSAIAAEIKDRYQLA